MRPWVLVTTPRSELEGDPSSWARALARLRALRDASGARGAGFVVVVLQDGPAGPVPPLAQDRMAGLCSNLSIDAK